MLLLNIAISVILKNNLDISILPCTLKDKITYLRKLTETDGIEYAIKNDSIALLNYYAITPEHWNKVLELLGKRPRKYKKFHMFCETITVVNWNCALVYAAKKNNFRLVRHCKIHKVSCWDLAQKAAARKGHFEMVKFCELNGALACEETVLNAIFSGHIEMVKYFEKILCVAPSVEYGQMPLLNAAVKSGNIEMVKYWEPVRTRWVFVSDRIIWYHALKTAGTIEMIEYCVKKHSKVRKTDSFYDYIPYNDIIYLAKFFRL